MSLEQIITENTAALRELTEALKKNSFEAPAKKEKAKVEKETAPAKEEVVVPKAKEEVAPAPAPAPASREDVSSAISKVCTAVSKEKAIELLKGFGATSGSTLKPESYTAFVEACKFVINSTEELN